MKVTITFRAENKPDVTIDGAEDIAVNQVGIMVVLGPKSGDSRPVLGAFPPDAVAGVYAPDGPSRIVPGL